MTRVIRQITNRWCKKGVIAQTDVAIIFCLAPVPHKNVGMSEAHRLTLRRFVRISTLLSAVFSIVLIHTVDSLYFIGIIMALGIGIAAFSMSIAHAKNLLTKP